MAPDGRDSIGRLEPRLDRRRAADKESALLAPLGDKPAAPSPVQFLPYLSGERTPHDDAAIRGAFTGLAHENGRDAMVQAVLEGVAFAFADCRDALAAAAPSLPVPT